MFVKSAVVPVLLAALLASSSSALPTHKKCKKHDAYPTGGSGDVVTITDVAPIPTALPTGLPTTDMGDWLPTPTPTQSTATPAQTAEPVNYDEVEVEDEVEEVKKEEPKKEEPKKEEPKKDEPKKDEPKKDEPKKDEPKKEDPQKDEPKKNDEVPKQDVVSIEKPADEKPKVEEVVEDIKDTVSDVADIISDTPAAALVRATAAAAKSAFWGQMNKGIGSWFRASSKQDSTNGKSWCGYPYKDYTPGFAPDILQMTGGVHAVYPHPKWAPSAQKYCGLEAIVKNPVNGKTMKLYIVDAFDHQYVKSPGSIDVMIKAWEQLWGGKADSKLKVMKDLQWTLTGNRNPKYAFQGKGDN